MFHDALQYFERRFKLRVAGSISMSPEVAPSAKRLSTLRTKIASLGAVCVFAEPQFDTRLVDNLVEGTRARTGTIDPEGSKIEPGPDLYFTLLRNLATGPESLPRAAGVKLPKRWRACRRFGTCPHSDLFPCRTPA